jgi:hypothetical protein
VTGALAPAVQSSRAAGLGTLNQLGRRRLRVRGGRNGREHEGQAEDTHAQASHLAEGNPRSGLPHRFFKPKASVDGSRRLTRE